MVFVFFLRFTVLETQEFGLNKCKRYYILTFGKVAHLDQFATIVLSVITKQVPTECLLLIKFCAVCSVQRKELASYRIKRLSSKRKGMECVQRLNSGQLRHSV